MTFPLLESHIKKQIIDYLSTHGIFHWVNQAGKIPGRRLLRVGISDILGIYKGRPLAIEVKSAKGKASPEQIKFMYEFREHGGLAFIVRSIEELEIELMRLG